LERNDPSCGAADLFGMCIRSERRCRIGDTDPKLHRLARSINESVGQRYARAQPNRDRPSDLDPGAYRDAVSDAHQYGST
jgi:hypothetical protein